MILIADSGGTKIDWRLLRSNGKIDQFQTSGFNAYTQSADEFRKIIGSLVEALSSTEVSIIYFYGAGISSPTNQRKIRESFSVYFPNVPVEIEWDLLAAARALCGSEPGIACILGTGSNSCVFDGERISSNIANLGWILADEGSGASLGRQFLVDYLRQQIPEEVATHFRERYPYSREEFLEKVYQQDKPAVYLAGFTKFIFQHLKYAYCYELVYKAFSAFYESNVMPYANFEKYKVHFTGSVAFYFSNILRQVGNDKGITVRNILETPIAGLTIYHQKQDLH